MRPDCNPPLDLPTSEREKQVQERGADAFSKIQTGKQDKDPISQQSARRKQERDINQLQRVDLIRI